MNQISDRDYIVISHLTASGYTYWRTYDPYDPDSGISGAGYESAAEALEDAVYPGDASDLYFVDMSSFGNSVLDMTDTALAAYVIEHATVEPPPLPRRSRSPK